MTVSRVPNAEPDSESSGCDMEVTVKDSLHTPPARSPRSPWDMFSDSCHDDRLSRSFSKDYVCIRIQESLRPPLPAEWWKTGVAFLWAGLNLFLTSVVVSVVNDRVPDKSTNPPLPDKFFDYVPRVTWAFTVTEVLCMLLILVWLLHWLFLKHKSIVGRRFFFLLGILYLYRIITMYITTLPVPSMHMECAPKLYNNSLMAMLSRAAKMFFRGGLSITGSRMCGDFMYSGHTIILTLIYLFIREYSSPSLWLYDWICWLLSAVAVVFILLAHEHYTLDVVVAYFITSRLFYWYHTMANSQSLKGSPPTSLRTVWWSGLFHFLERNVRAPVPPTFSWPGALPARFSTRPFERYSRVHSVRED